MKVVCINEVSGLTIHKSYTTYGQSCHMKKVYYLILDDSNSWRDVNSDNFITLESYRINRIEEILYNEKYRINH